MHIPGLPHLWLVAPTFAGSKHYQWVLPFTGPSPWHAIPLNLFRWTPATRCHCLKPTALKSEGQFAQGTWDQVLWAGWWTPLTPITGTPHPRSLGDRKLGIYSVALSPLAPQLTLGLSHWGQILCPFPPLASYFSQANLLVTGNQSELGRG